MTWRWRLGALGAFVLLAACSSPVATGAPSTPTAAVSDSLAAEPSPTEDAATASPSASEAATAEPAAPASWAALEATGPIGREDHTWTVDPNGETAYLFGGRDRATVFGDLWAYDLATDSWSELVASGGPEPRFGHEAVWLEGTGLVVFAGQAGSSFFNDLWTYEPATATWTQLPSSGAIPTARYGSCAAIGPDGRLWISHGFTSEGSRFHDTVVYDFEAGAWTDETPEAPRPVDRCLHGCWWTDAGELALFGGQTTGVIALGDLWLLRDGAWVMVDGALPADRNLYARARVGTATLVFGGQAVDESYLGDAFFLIDGEADAVALDVTGPAPRAGSEMIADPARDRVLLFGGRDAAQAFDDLWELRGAVPAG